MPRCHQLLFLHLSNFSGGVPVPIPGCVRIGATGFYHLRYFRCCLSLQLFFIINKVRNVKPLLTRCTLFCAEQGDYAAAAPMGWGTTVSSSGAVGVPLPKTNHYWGSVTKLCWPLHNVLFPLFSLTAGTTPALPVHRKSSKLINYWVGLSLDLIQFGLFIRNGPHTAEA
jgi:hypothetical protein